MDLNHFINGIYRKDSVVQLLLAEHNKIRVSHGLTPLTLSGRLARAAQLHSQDQSDTNQMSHTGSDGSSPFDRIGKTGYKFGLAGENIAWNYPDITSVMSGWMNSPGHRANILTGGFTEFGAAEVNKYWTAVFATPISSISTDIPVTSNVPSDLNKFFPEGITYNNTAS